MHYLHWNSDLNTGIFEIDGQHRRIMDLINRLQRLARQERSLTFQGEAMLEPLFPEEGADHSQILAAIEDLIDYTLNHFSFEEGLMERAGHPATLNHCKAHQAFRRHVIEVRGLFEAGHDVLDDLLSLLGHWLFKHIAHDDLELSELSASRGVPAPANAELLMPPGELFKDVAA